MRIGFYAPLKAPDHPVPSGDREIAGALLQALRLGGHDTVLASRLRSFDRHGDSCRQRRLHAVGQRIAGRLIARWQRAGAPELWFTYHLHHKAPDFLGPAVTRALGIPYVVAEASVAPRQRAGAWAAGFVDAHDAIRSADTVVFVNPADVTEVRRVRAPDAPFALLAPFIDVARFAGPAVDARTPRAPGGRLRIITVAMMRDGAKLASYRLLADALARVADLRLELSIVGDGPARAAVEAAFAGLADRVSFLGARTKPEVAALLREADIFVWPAVDEAIGIALIEAQACGLPVVAGKAPGVAAVVADACTGLLTPAGDGVAFADAVRRLALDASLRERMGAQAQAYVRRQHDLPAAGQRLDAILRDVVVRHRRAQAPVSPC